MKKAGKSAYLDDIAKAGGLASLHGGGSLYGGGIQQFLVQHGAAESADVDAALGQFIVQNSLPFQPFESPQFKEFCVKVSHHCSGKHVYKPPDRKKIASLILDLRTAKVKGQVKELIKRNKDYGVGVSSDGWQDCKGNDLFVQVMLQTVMHV